MTPKPLKLGTYANSVTSANEAFNVCYTQLCEYAKEVATRFVRKPRTWASVNLMCRALNRLTVPFGYWGRHPSDSTQYGVWIDLGKMHEAEEWGKLVQASSLKAAKSGVYVLVAEGDGLALYHRRTGREMWRTV